jgi:regulator of protease activity HflC (stomatin/prohibitin superfamily)
MGIVQEIVDLISKLKFYDTVYEYEQGLQFRCGKAVSKKKRRLTPAELEDIISDEAEVVRLNGKAKFITPFARPEMPDGYMRSFWTGMPLSPKRRSKILRPGFYLYVPFVEDIVKDHQQETVLNVPYVSSPTTDDIPNDKVMAVSCNVRYKLVDLYMAYTVVHDYKTSLKDYVLSIMGKESRGKSYAVWRNPAEVCKTEKRIMAGLEKVVKKGWGIDILDVYITDNAPCTVNRVVHEGTAVSVENKITPAA